MMNVHLGGKKKDTWTSLVVQWLRIHLPMKGTQVQSLVQEDPTCHKAWPKKPQLAQHKGVCIFLIIQIPTNKKRKELVFVLR